MTRAPVTLEHVVILVHGIRDEALWMQDIRATLQDEGFLAEPTNLDRISAADFANPFSTVPDEAINELERQINGIFKKYRNRSARFSVIAHSFGTYAFSEVLKRHKGRPFHKLIFCGSIVRFDFPFEDYQTKFKEPVCNEVGTFDFWPALATRVNKKYGRSGSVGFKVVFTQDYWHLNARHSDFLNSEFCRKYWIPVLRDRDSERPRLPVPKSPSFAVSFLSHIGTMHGAVAIALLACAFLYWNMKPVVPFKIADPRTVASSSEWAEMLGTLSQEAQRSGRQRELTLALTPRLLPRDSDAPARTRQEMNRQTVRVVMQMMNKNLSEVWQKFPENRDLSGADFSGANLRGVNFEETDLSRAMFQNAALDGATFSSSNVRHARFDGASMEGVSFKETDWYNAANISTNGTRSSSSRMWEWLKCPTDFKYTNESFIRRFETRYTVDFGKLTDGDQRGLYGSWGSYSDYGQLCVLAQ
jgi:hypothetical protein